jgi:hypothetical protein
MAGVPTPSASSPDFMTAAAPSRLPFGRDADLGAGWVLPAATLTAIAWALQHTVIPALPSRRYAVMRAMTMLPFSAAFIAVYTTRGRRLAPFAAAHSLSDTSAAPFGWIVAFEAQRVARFRTCTSRGIIRPRRT